jgi:hypothetical protein
MNTSRLISIRRNMNIQLTLRASSFRSGRLITAFAMMLSQMIVIDHEMKIRL